ncbi:MAG TPA: ABC transporter substrate-binding protein [Burkholderiales bacterium]|nr:ABC transporter substrate-binding protein [Burkholderiales bacterium]HYV25965.1 ABC transporter substrate-binding protein [Candidatus Eisenbacteria bacterium]
MNHGNRPARALATLGCIVAFAGAWSAAHAQSREPVKIGMLLSFSGAIAESGFDARMGASIAAREINAAGGLLGRQIVLVEADDQSNPTNTVTEARRLVQREKVEAVVGPLASQLVLAALPITTEAKVPHFTVAGSLAITPQIGPYHFSILPSALSQGGSMVEYVRDVLKAKEVALLTDAGAQAKSAAEVIKTGLAEAKIRLTAAEEYTAGQTNDVTPQLLNLKRGNPPVLVLFAQSGGDTGLIIKTLRELSWSPRIVGNFSVIAAPPVVTKIAGADAFDNVVGSNYKAFVYCAGDAPGSSAFAKLIEKIRADARPQSSPTTVSYIYDAMYALKAAVEGTGSLDGPKVAAWMEANAPKVRVTAGTLNASKTNHFLIGADALGMTEHPERLRSDGLAKRAGC